MADAEPGPKKPRIRKTAPTVRERAEAARAQVEKEKPARLGKLVSSVKKPLSATLARRPGLPRNRLTIGLGLLMRPFVKVLGWLVPRYFINSWREVRQVTWTSRRETWRLTGAVFVFAIIFGSAAYGVDKALDIIFKRLVLK